MGIYYLKRNGRADYYCGFGIFGAKIYGHVNYPCSYRYVHDNLAKVSTIELGATQVNDFCLKCERVLTVTTSSNISTYNFYADNILNGFDNDFVDGKKFFC